MAPFPSKFPGRCPTCSRSFPAGTPVVRLTAGWGHAACANSTNAASPRAPSSTRPSSRPYYGPRRCRVCGYSGNFTTMAGGDVCDDCL